MAALTTAQELAAIQEAIQTLTATGQSVVAVNVDGVSVSYAASQLPMLADREKELLRRLTIRNSRKRVTPDFSGDRDYLSL